MAITGNNGFAMQHRTETGGGSGNSSTGTGDELGSYVRLTRSGDTLTGEYSRDGINWTVQATRTISMADEVQIGLAYTNRSTGTAHVATFRDLTVTGATQRPFASSLAAPSGLAIAAGVQGALTASWNPVVGAVGYSVATSLDNFSWSEVTQTDAATLDHTVNGLDGDRRHFTRVAALDANGDWSTWSDVVFADTRPGAITNLEVKTFSSTELVLDWREANGEIGYRIERSTDGINWVNAGEVGAQVPSFTDSGLDPETTYQYRVITLDDFGDAATSTSATKETSFSQLTDLQATETASQETTLSWTDNNANETGYLVERKHEVGSWETIGTTNADAEQFVDSNLPWYGRFEYRVSPQHPSILPSTSSVEHWTYGASTLFRFDDSGDTLIDDGTTISSQLIDGTNTARVAGKTGNGLQFNGTDSGVNLGQTASIHGTIDFTIGAWIKTSGTSDAFIVGQRDGQWQGWQTYYRFRMLADGRLRFQINNRHEGGNQFNLLTSATVNDGQWHYVVAQREGDAGRIYIDGVEAASGSGSVKWLNGDIATAIGYNLRDNNNYFDGVIDDLRIIDQAITPAQMSAIMNNQGPTVAEVEVNGGEAQRSGVQTVRVNFDQTVNIDLDAGDAFRFVNADTAEIVEDVPTISEVNGKTVVDFTFLPGVSVNAAGGLMVT
jgi:hypothetical protein